MPTYVLEDKLYTPIPAVCIKVKGEREINPAVEH